jgi:hypothetical protein
MAYGLEFLYLVDTGQLHMQRRVSFAWLAAQTNAAIDVVQGNASRVGGGLADQQYRAGGALNDLDQQASDRAFHAPDVDYNLAWLRSARLEDRFGVGDGHFNDANDGLTKVPSNPGQRHEPNPGVGPPPEVAIPRNPPPPPPER